MKRTTLKKKSLYWYAVAHLLLICIIVITEAIPSVKLAISNEKLNKSSKDSSSVELTLRQATKIPILYQYLLISGSDVAYSFFAPKVANSLTIECTQFDQTGKEINTTYFPSSLKTHEGIQRYSVLVSNFHGSVRSLEKVERQYLYNSITTSMGHKIISTNYNKYTLRSKVSLCSYVFPSMKEFLQGVQPKLVSLTTVNL